LIFILLGLATSALSGLLITNRQILSKIGGIVVIVFGVHMTGLVRIPFLDYDLRPQTAPDRNRGYLASALMGVFFSAGWSPCVGPILGSILTVAALNTSNMADGAMLLAAYSAGLALPFLFASTQISLITNVIRKHGKVMRYVEIGMGVVLMGVGALLFSGKFAQLASLAFFFSSIDEAQVGRYLLLGLVGLLVLGLIPAVIARGKGRSFIDWWFFGSSLFPIALIAALFIRPNKDLVEADPEGEEKVSLDSQGSTP
jgi:cytochrome c-type biogenesis protein